MSTVISVENLGKRYELGAGRSNERYTALRDVIANKARSLFRPQKPSTLNAQRSTSPSSSDFWALKDVSFDIQQGEVVGIIGRNGAGKSTLLKVLSRITDPTEGRIKIRGRVASLLEVGTGFHPELTGRENIYLNGAILGMSRAEIKAKFDEIVAFAEVEKFLDTPVKRYSSGMYVRLAFSVAAHLEPEILIVDEVLAVGDAQFQKKCLGKMQDVSTKEGRTILFVSHDLQAVRKLCSHGLVLNNGHIEMDGQMSDAIDAYMIVGQQTNGHKTRSGEGSIQLESLTITDRHDTPIDRIEVGGFLKITFHCLAKQNVNNVMFAACFDTLENIRAVSLYSSYSGQAFNIKKGQFSIVCEASTLHLMPGEYTLTTFIEANGIALDLISGIRSFNIDLPQSGNCLTIPNLRQGFFIENFEWQRPTQVRNAFS